MIEVTPELIAALRTARAQCLIRVVQLSGCRTCGNDQQRFTDAVKQIDQLIPQLERQHAVQVLESKS